MSRLEQIGNNIWLVEETCVNFYGFAYPTRSVIIRLASGALWFWSPIQFSPELKEEIDQLGSLKHLISPNKLHHLFLGDWYKAYPDALLWVRNLLSKKNLSSLFNLL